MAAPKGNKYWEARGKDGRSKKYSSPEEMEGAIQEYFDSCENNTREVYDKKKQEVITVKEPIPYTIEGLALALDFDDRSSLLDYQKEKGYEDFFHTIKKAKLKVQQNKVTNGLNGNYNPAVAIFDLKNNHGYRDKNETDITTDGEKLTAPVIYIPDNGRRKAKD